MKPKTPSYLQVNVADSHHVRHFLHTAVRSGFARRSLLQPVRLFRLSLHQVRGRSATLLALVSVINKSAYQGRGRAVILAQVACSWMVSI